MLKDTRHPTYTSCPIWNPALSVYATNINHLIHENLNSIHENTTTDRKIVETKKIDILMIIFKLFEWLLNFGTIEILEIANWKIQKNYPN